MKPRMKEKVRKKLRRTWEAAHNWGALLYLLAGALITGFLDMFDRKIN